MQLIGFRTSLPYAWKASLHCLECGAHTVIDEPQPGNVVTCRSCEAELVVGVERVERSRRRTPRRRRTVLEGTHPPGRTALRNFVSKAALVLFLIGVVIVVVAQPEEAERTYAWLQMQLAQRLSWWW